MKTRKKTRAQLEDEDLEARKKRFHAEIKFVLDSLPPEEQLIALLVYERTPMVNEDSPFIRMRRLIETKPEERSALIAAWKEELARGIGRH